MTKIEWVVNPDGSKGETWNPLVGCKKVSPGCANCYAERMAKRLKTIISLKILDRLKKQVYIRYISK